ncbi:tetratricopeptide repeat protein [Streptomyces sp. NPDC002962]|uniref:tetratricopeptide repeat protein n=1 Tax=Streptomyces sp. NPDC002962 TaxID=3364674 RepID=UPI003675E36F
MNIAQVVVGDRAGGEEGLVTLAAPVGERDWRVPLRGREALVGELVGVWNQGADGLVHVLHGMSGCGKTAVALELLARVQGGGQAAERAWWVDARHTAGFVARMRAVTRQVGVQEVRAGGVADALWERLGGAGYRWLLVVDGVDEVSLLDGPGAMAAGTGWIRPHRCGSGMVVVTSGCGMGRLWGGGAVLHAVGPLSAEDAAGVLLDHAGGGGTRAQARALARRLGGLPLALRIAASYVSEVTGMPEALRGGGVPTDFAAFQAALDEYGAGVNPAGAVAGTWRMSVELLHRQGLVHARYLVGVLAAFAAAPIPYTVLLQPAVLAVLPGGEGLDGRTVWRTLRELAALQLVDLDVSTPDGEGPLCVSLHPLIRDIARAGAQSAVVVSLMERVLRLPEVCRSPQDPQSWPLWRALVPHCLDLLRWGRSEAAGFSRAERVVCAEAAERAALFLQVQGMHWQARESLEEVLALRAALGADELATASTRHRLALTLHSLGKWDAAQELYEQVWHAVAASEGADHPRALAARHELGRLLVDRGRLAEAQEHLRAVREVREAAGGVEHPDALNARHELARVLHLLEQWPQACSEYEALLAAQRRLSGPGHPRTVTAWHNYACLLQDMGQPEEARRECAGVLEARQALHGDDHLSTLNTKFLMAVILWALDRQRQARETMAEVEERSRVNLGDAHPLTRRCEERLQRWDSVSSSGC